VIVEIASFHHAENLDTTLRECARVLRPGGVLIAIERAHPDHVSDAELEILLDRSLSVERKRQYGVPEDQVFTRRDWGEHEYRIMQWLAAFERAGFDAACLRPWRVGRRYLDALLSRLPVFWASLSAAAMVYRFGGRRLVFYSRWLKHTLFVCVRRPSGA
jgi:SAM-dependent methyltransferase